MTHLKRKLMMTLALLITAATGAWATDETLLTTITPTGDGTYSETTAGAVTVTPAGSFFYSNSSYGWRWDDYGSLTVTANEGYTITRCVFIQQGKNQSVTISEAPFALNFEAWVCYENYSMDGVTSIEVYGTAPAAPAGPTVTFSPVEGKTNEWTLDGGMPAGNVVVNVTYCDLATLATGAVTAATEAAANTDAELVTVADGAATGGTLMYYVTTDANFTQAQAIALAETAWSEDVPTADGLNFDTATDVYVWYYLKGDADHSDTDPVCVAVTLLPEPTYAVTFAEGVNPEPPAEPEWTASPAADVKKGQTVTVTYTGSKKVIGVKAEKKKPLIINPVVGQVIGSDGKNYAYGSLPTGVTAVAKICYVSGSNGLALALTDEGEMNWNSAIETCAAHTPAFTSGTWKLPSKDEWEKMISAAGSYTALRNGFSSVGGTNLQGKAYYSSTEGDSNKVWRYLFDLGSGGYVDKDANRYARACLAF